MRVFFVAQSCEFGGQAPPLIEPLCRASFLFASILFLLCVIERDYMCYSLGVRVSLRRPWVINEHSSCEESRVVEGPVTVFLVEINPKWFLVLCINPWRNQWARGFMNSCGWPYRGLGTFVSKPSLTVSPMTPLRDTQLVERRGEQKRNTLAIVVLGHACNTFDARGWPSFFLPTHHKQQQANLIYNDVKLIIYVVQAVCIYVAASERKNASKFKCIPYAHLILTTSISAKIRDQFVVYTKKDKIVWFESRWVRLNCYVVPSFCIVVVIFT